MYGGQLEFVFKGEGEFKQRRNRAIPVLRLCKADFDASLDLEYESEKGELHIKGGFNYHEPSREWLRVGLNVRGKYENDKWMGESEEEGEWIVAYYGSKTLSGWGMGYQKESSYYCNWKEVGLFIFIKLFLV